MKAKLGAIALAVASALFSNAHAATTFKVDSEGDYISWSTINGVDLNWTDAALWSDPATPFDLASTAFKVDWPLGWGDAPPVDDPSTSGDESKTYYAIRGFRNGVEVAYMSVSDNTPDDGINQADPAGALGWGEVRTATLNWTNLDLVTWHSSAYSEGTVLKVLDMTGAGITPAVPEPETYAMLLAGLGITAMAARRRRKQS